MSSVKSNVDDSRTGVLIGREGPGTHSGKGPGKEVADHGDLLPRTGNSTQYSDIIYMGKEAQRERMHVDA